MVREFGPNLRILILSTPKTGSTWLRSLLSGIYRLPHLYLEPGFDCEALSRAGSRWIAQYHVRPRPDLTAWVREQGAVVITTIRHPADVLISLYHHIRNFRAQKLDVEFVHRMLCAGFERTNITIDSHGRPFWTDLAYSLDWMSESGTEVVRYERLRSDPLGTLRKLTSRICAAPDERLNAAIEMSDLQLMRAMAGPFARFFREARIGRWRELLPPEIVDVFRSMPPYPTLMARLGYSVEPREPVSTGEIKPRPRHPMSALRSFDNGVAVVPILVQCFFWASAEEREGWNKRLASTAESSFYRWLYLPCRTAGREIYEGLALSNLAAFIYVQRPDLRQAFPDLAGSDRYGYALWFLRRAQAEYGLATTFVDAQRRALERWANTILRIDGSPATNFVWHLCRTHTDVPGSFPRLAGKERRQLIRAIIAAGRDIAMDPDYTARLERTLGRHWLPRSARVWIASRLRLRRDRRETFLYSPEKFV
jgi:LPS sulfotransferase NodH